MVPHRIAQILKSNSNLLKWDLFKRFTSTSQSSTPPKSTAAPKIETSRVNENVAGLSSNCLNVPNAAVGPGASAQGEYKVPEYFCYDKNSYFEAEREILRYRLPQPSNKS